MSEHNSRNKAYFKQKAAQYDDVDTQLYWVLSDAFYKEVLKRELAPILRKKKIRILDAGAGTGRWTLNFHEIFGATHDLEGVLIDLSPEMLAVAKRKIDSKGWSEKFLCKEGDIESLDDLDDSSFDVSLSFYNVLSFVANPELALREVSRKLRPEGVHIAIVANTYHALYFSILTNRLSQMQAIESNSTVRFNDYMPPIRTFTPHELKDMYLNNGFSSAEIMGGPNFIYPGMEETLLQGQSELLKRKLSEEYVMNTILDIELKHYKDPSIACRSNTLFAIASR